MTEKQKSVVRLVIEFVVALLSLLLGIKIGG